MPLPYLDNNHDQFPAEPDIEQQQDEALSPTDGYFHASDSSHAASPAVPLVPNVLVEDPSLRDRGTDAKAREAEEEQGQISSQGQPSNESRARSLPFARHHHRRSIEDEAFPSASYTPPQASPYQQASVSFPLNNRGTVGETRSLLQHPDAPPAYSPAGLGYQTIVGRRGVPLTSDRSPSVMGVPEEQQRLLPSPHTREPQSMGGAPSDDYPRRQNLCQRFRESLTGVNTRRLVTTLLGALLILSIVSLVYGALFGHKDVRYSKPVFKHDSNMEWSPHGQCYNRPYTFPKITKKIDFISSKSLSVTQSIEVDVGPPHGRQPHVFGELIIKPTEDPNAQSSGQLDVEVISNDESLEAQFTYDDGAQKYTVTVPGSVDWRVSNLSPCIQIRITVWAPPEAVLDMLDVQLVHLDVDIRDGVQLDAALGAAIRSASGKVNAPTHPHEFRSRNIEITTVSGDVQGWYPLYDLLRVRSESGTIKVDIGHKTASSDHPQPAILHLTTVSGDVTATGTDMGDSIPARDYMTTISTVSGTVKAKVPFSSIGKFDTKSADFDLDLTPVLDQGGRPGKPKLTTKTVSGTTKVVLRSPLWVNLAATSSSEEQQHVMDVSRTLANLHSDHSSMSGDIKLRYPSAWEGMFYADSMSGSQTFRGDGVHVDRKHGWVNKVVEGHKGSGKSELKVHSISGSEDFLVE